MKKASDFMNCWDLRSASDDNEFSTVYVLRKAMTARYRGVNLWHFLIYGTGYSNDCRAVRLEAVSWNTLLKSRHRALPSIPVWDGIPTVDTIARSSTVKTVVFAPLLTMLRQDWLLIRLSEFQLLRPSIEEGTASRRIWLF